MTIDEPQSLRERLPGGRFKWVALGIAVILASVFMIGFFGWEDELIPEKTGYPSAQANDVRGFYSGSQVDGVLFFTFYGSTTQPHPLLSYRAIHTDEIYMVAYAPGVKDMSLEVEIWKTRHLENATEIYDKATYTEELYSRGFEFNTIRIPSSSVYQDIRITYEGEEIWRGGHVTNEAYVEAGSRTHGEIAADRAIFMAMSVVVALAAFGSVKELYEKVKVVPKVPDHLAILVAIVLGIGLTAAVYELIVRYAVKQILWLGIPIYVSSFYFAVWLMRPKYDTWWFLGLQELQGRPWADLIGAEVVFDGETPILASIGWLDFIKGKRRRVLVKTEEGDPIWYYPVEGETNDRLYYVKDQRYDAQGYNVSLAGIHKQKIEEYKAGLVAEESTASALSKMTRRAIRAEADQEKKAIEHGARMAIDYIEEILVAMKLRSPRQKEEDPKVEQTRKN